MKVIWTSAARLLDKYPSQGVCFAFFRLIPPSLDHGHFDTFRYSVCGHFDIIYRIEGVLRRFTKKIAGTKNMTYEERLKWLKFPSLEYRRVRGDLIEVYKMVHGFYDSNTTATLFNLCN